MADGRASRKSLPVDEQGRPRGFGSRRHYTFSSRAYWEESARIVEALSRRYGDHPALVGWQTDNEYRLPRHRALVGRRTI